MVRFCSAVLLALLLVLASPEASITASGPDAPPVCSGAVADVPFIWPPTDVAVSAGKVAQQLFHGTNRSR